VAQAVGRQGVDHDAALLGAEELDGTRGRHLRPVGVPGARHRHVDVGGNGQGVAHDAHVQANALCATRAVNEAGGEAREAHAVAADVHGVIAMNGNADEAVAVGVLSLLHEGHAPRAVATPGAGAFLHHRAALHLLPWLGPVAHLHNVLEVLPPVSLLVEALCALGDIEGGRGEFLVIAVFGKDGKHIVVNGKGL